VTVADADETYAEEASAAPRLVPGAQLGRFALRRVLGEGGMGVVWAAHDPDLDREIAIKLLRHHMSASAALRKRLLREARAMARLKHPNVITVYEVGTAGDTDFIAMELVEGTTLDSWLAHAPPSEEVWRSLVAAGRGLAAAHAAGLVHRDFKPHNVLRSRDGRVLVTDFGLARGLGDDEAAPVALPATAALDETVDATKAHATPSRTDSLLDSPLTQTGALIGTPAYMAPEQFHGAPPDPRTDQFAYCVTAWQALTGARPFHGDTLEELRRAASRGVADVVADLPKPLRAVLARGLDPDPAQRWPDLDALIDALEATRRTRARVWPFVLAGAVVVAAVVFAATRDRERAPAAATCEPAARAFAEAWSDDARAELGDGKVSAAATARVARGFEQLRAKWSASYQEACNAPPSKHADARLACLRGVRDHTAAVRLVLNDADQRAFEALDVHGLLPSLAVCDGPTPIAPPEVPADQPRRDQVLALLARTLALRGVPDDALPAATEALVAGARRAGWTPLVPMVQVTAGNAFLRRGDVRRARVLLRAALPAADARFQAIAHVALLEAAIYELEQPGDDARDEIARALTYARSAVRAAGNDPMLAGTVAVLEAEAQAARAPFSGERRPYDEALQLAAEARAQLEKAGDLRRVATIAALEGELHLARAHPRALDDAEYVTRSADEKLDEPGSMPALAAVRARIAFARGDYREAHARFDRLPREAAPAEGPPRRGRVVDASGRGVRATVVAWRGELHGDPVRAYTDPRFAGEVIETAADGTFEHRTRGALIAQTGDGRSAPRRAGDDVTLVIARTTSASGTVAGVPGPLVTAFARYRIGDATWFVHAPLDDGRFELDRLPPGAYALGVHGPAGDGERAIVDRPGKLRWPARGAVEVILRGDHDAHTARAWILRGKVTARTRGEVEALAASASDVASAAFRTVGASATAPGREVYRAGDRHAIIDGNALGDVTVCVALVDVRSARAYCSPLAVVDGSAPAPILFETAP
jgi:tRNA A-37 threonylcarbamoyl transferase component Bud32/tetratricopeptide (TPR) repeat protein